MGTFCGTCGGAAAGAAGVTCGCADADVCCAAAVSGTTSSAAGVSRSARTNSDLYIAILSSPRAACEDEAHHQRARGDDSRTGPWRGVEAWLAGNATGPCEVLQRAASYWAVASAAKPLSKDRSLGVSQPNACGFTA